MIRSCCLPCHWHCYRRSACLLAAARRATRVIRWSRCAPLSLSIWRRHRRAYAVKVKFLGNLFSERYQLDQLTLIRKAHPYLVNRQRRADPRGSPAEGSSVPVVLTRCDMETSIRSAVLHSKQRCIRVQRSVKWSTTETNAVGRELLGFT